MGMFPPGSRLLRLLYSATGEIQEARRLFRERATAIEISDAIKGAMAELEDALEAARYLGRR